MSLIIATGANLGDKRSNLKQARILLSEQFEFVAQSNIYSSPPVGYEEQPEFFNQVLEFKIPDITPDEVLLKILEIEERMGRKREFKWGPRIIDLDILFWGDTVIDKIGLQVPHPRWSERAFVVLPLRELPFFRVLSKKYKIPEEFDHNAVIVS